MILHGAAPGHNINKNMSKSLLSYGRIPLAIKKIPIFYDASLYQAVLPSTTLTLTAQGDGTSVAYIGNIDVGETHNLTITIDGNGKFYTDPSGTIGESTSVTFLANSTYRNINVKVTSGVSNLTFIPNTALIKWGEATSSNNGVSGYSAYDPNTVNAPKITLDNWNFPNCRKTAFFYSQTATFTGNLSIIAASNFTNMLMFISGSMSGDISSIPANCVIFSDWANTLSGNISSFPSTLEQTYIGGSNTITGDVINLPHAIKNIVITGNNTISGNIVNLPQQSLTEISIWGNNTIAGDIKDISVGLQNISIYGLNTISGDIGNIPNGNLQNMTIGGHNTLSGNIGNLPKKYLTAVDLEGYNTINGDIKDLSTGLSQFLISGNNTITGNINNIGCRSINDFRVWGKNTISGSLDTSVYNLTSIYNLTLDGSNAVSGSLNNVPKNATTIRLLGLNTIDSYTSGRTWSANLYDLTLYPVSPGGLSATEVDNLFIDLSTYCTYHGTITIRGTNAAPTAASADARAALQARGYTINVNS